MVRIGLILCGAIPIAKSFRGNPSIRGSLTGKSDHEE
jgi:hypothetical protein